MTSGYDEAHREIAPTTLRRWHVAVDRPDGVWNLYLEASSALEAMELLVWRGSFSGAEVRGITITEDS